MLTRGRLAIIERWIDPASTEPAAPRLRHRILRASGWAGSGFILDKAIAAVQLMVLTRLLSPADFGVMAASATIMLALLTISELGLEPALIAKAKVDRDDLAVAWTIAIGRAVILMAGLWLAADVLAQAMQMPQLAAVLRVHVWMLFIQGLQSPAMVLLVKQLDLRRRVSVDLVRRLTEAGVTIALALAVGNVWALLAGQLAGMSVSVLLSFWVAPFRPALSLNLQRLAALLRFGAYVNVTSLLVFAVMSGGEFVVGRMLGPEALGVYTLALALPVMAGMRAPILISQISRPVYAQLQRDQAGTIRTFGLHFGLLVMVLFPLACGIAVSAPEIVQLLGGERWTAAAEPLRALALFAFCSGITEAMGSLQYGLGLPELPLRVWIGQVAVYAVVIVPFTQYFGLTGAAWAMSVTYLCGSGLYLVYTSRLLGAAAWLVFSPLLRALIPGVAGLALYELMRHLSGGSALTPWMLAGWLLAAGSLYLLYVWRVEYPRLLQLWQA